MKKYNKQQPNENNKTQIIMIKAEKFFQQNCWCWCVISVEGGESSQKLHMGPILHFIFLHMKKYVLQNPVLVKYVYAVRIFGLT